MDLLRKGMETTGWGIEVFEPLLSNHARKFQVMQPFAPSEDAEGKYHDARRGPSNGHLLASLGAKSLLRHGFRMFSLGSRAFSGSEGGLWKRI